MDDRALERENLRYLAARAAVDSGMNEQKAYKLLENDFRRANRNPRVAESLKKVLKRDFQI